jgi:ABC-2 type transport system permease protein
MYTIFKKEIRSFFSSFTGYMVIVVFLLLNSLFMWIFKGGMNILDNAYASLDTLFSLAPWLFLFLVPAITMRMLAEERKSGTMELLLTRPITESDIVMAKFLASWVLICLSLLPTLIFYISVWVLGNPPGNIDSGGTWGSYLGLFFLGGIYAAIGIFSSSLTDNQVIAFILSVSACFIFYLGFGFISTVGPTGQIMHVIEMFGIDYHYQSISRGVIDSRDIIYFLSVIVLFVYTSRVVIGNRN